jgi:hypothetical protein
MWSSAMLCDKVLSAAAGFARTDMAIREASRCGAITRAEGEMPSRTDAHRRMRTRIADLNGTEAVFDHVLLIVSPRVQQRAAAQRSSC